MREDPRPGWRGRSGYRRGAISANGKVITAIEIEGVTGGTLGAGQTVYDLTLNNVLVSAVSVGDSTGGTATTQASFNYGQIGLVTTSQNPDGSLGAHQTFGWNLLTNAAIDPATLVVPTNTPVAAVPDPVTYYLRIDGIAGNSTSKVTKAGSNCRRSASAKAIRVR